MSTGLAVMTEMMEAEITDRVGPKHAKLADRTAVRHTPTKTSVVLGGRKVPIVRPRARTVDNTEVQLDTFATFANEDVLNQVVLERMLAGVATRRHRAAAEPVGHDVESSARSTSKSSEDLGADYFQRRRDPERQKTRLIHQLEQLGYTVTLAETPAPTDLT